MTHSSSFARRFDRAFAGKRRRSTGVGLVTAIFLVVVLAGLAVALVALSTSRSQGAALDEEGARAYQAARAGIEWGVYQQLRRGGCSGVRSFALPQGSALEGFVVTVTCPPPPAPPDPAAPPPPGVVRIRSEACSAALPQTCADAPVGPDYVRRVIEVQL